LGGHIDSAWANPNECLSQVRGGLVRILGVAAPERIKIFPDVPTFKEMGYDAVYRQFRAVSGAPGMPDYAVKTIAEALKKVSETEDWQKGYIEKNGLTSLYLGPEEYAKFLKDVKWNIGNHGQISGCCKGLAHVKKGKPSLLSPLMNNAASEGG
jgi:putative tricarboxylic transport membrane protein